MLLSPWAPPPDGVAFHSKSLVDAWRLEGHEVAVVTSRSRDRRNANRPIVDENGVNVIRCLGLIPRRTSKQHLLDFQPDALVVQFAIASQNTALISSIVFTWLARRLGFPVVTAFHEPAREIDRLGPLSRLIYRAVAKNTSSAAAYSKAGAAALTRSGLFVNATTLPHGCSSPVRVTDEDLDRVRDRYRVTSPLVLSLGFTHVDKGTDLLVRAMSDVDRSLEGNVQFLLAGSPRTRRGIFRLMASADRRFHETLTMETRKLMGTTVQLSGYVPSEDVLPLLNLASAVVLPYRRATQSGVANLALAARAIVLASDIPELKDDLGPAALYFKSGSVPDLVKKLVTILREPHDELRDEAGIRATERQYDIVAKRLITLGLSEEGEIP